MAYVPSGAKSAIRAAIDSAFGPIPASATSAEQTALNAARDNLAVAIEALGTYIKANVQVASGIAVSTSGGNGSTTSTGTLQ